MKFDSTSIGITIELYSVFPRPTEALKENSSEEKTEADATNDAKEQVVKATRARGRLVVLLL